MVGGAQALTTQHATARYRLTYRAVNDRGVPMAHSSIADQLEQAVAACEATLCELDEALIRLGYAVSAKAGLLTVKYRGGFLDIVPSRYKAEQVIDTHRALRASAPDHYCPDCDHSYVAAACHAVALSDDTGRDYRPVACIHCDGYTVEEIPHA